MWAQHVVCLAQAWESSRSFADAYKLGKTEADAAVNLLQNICSAAVTKLAESIRTDFCLTAGDVTILALAVFSFFLFVKGSMAWAASSVMKGSRRGSSIRITTEPRRRQVLQSGKIFLATRMRLSFFCATGWHLTTQRWCPK